LIGQYQTEPQQIASGHRSPPDFGAAYAQGRALARACAECHGVDLTGDALAEGPDLRIAAAYDLPAFERLLRTGVALNGRRPPLMGDSAPKRFNVLTHDEIATLHAYLSKRVEALP